MASDSTSVDQSVTFFSAVEGGSVSVPISTIDETYHSIIAMAINLGTEVGALFIMLVIMLFMTPRVRFKQPTTVVNLLALVFTLIRMTLFTVYLGSTWTGFAPSFAYDNSSVPRVDYNVSIVGSVFNILVTFLVLLALALQAWSMIRLWPVVPKIASGIISLLAVLVSVGLTFAVTVTQIDFILHGTNDDDSQRLINTQIGFLSGSIFWFCFLFIVRLVHHMHQTRSILPNRNKLTAMDALVYTNAVLMVVPVVFAIQQYTSAVDFYAYTWTQTSVAIILPLGSLAAQRLSNPSAFSYGAGGLHFASAVNSNVSGGGGAAASLNSRHPLLPTRSANPAAANSASRFFQPGQAHSGLAPRTGGVTAEASYVKPEEDRINVVDRELPHIDDGDLEMGIALGGVRVDRRIESSEEHIGEAQ